jgi:hypothetical protein
MMEGSSLESALHACSKRCPNRQAWSPLRHSLEPCPLVPLGAPQQGVKLPVEWSFRAAQQSD